MLLCCLLALTVFFLITGECAVEVEIACPGFVNTTAGAMALAFTGPAFELAVEEVNQRYGGIFHFTLTYLYEDNGNATGLIDDGTFLLSDWYYRRRVFPHGLAFVVSPAILDVTTIHQLVDSWNSLYFQTGLQTRSGYRRQPSVPVLSTGSSRTTSLARIMTSFVTFFNFTTLFVVAEVKNSPFDSKVTFDEYLLSLAAAPNLTVHSRQIAAETYEKSRLSYQPLLNEFTAVSRVMIFFGRPDHLRRLLIDASARKMTNGEYVYATLLPGPFQSPARFGNMSWQYEDGHDHIAKAAFRSLLVFQEHLDERTIQSQQQIRELMRKIRRRSLEVFGIPFEEKDMPSRALIDCYTTVLVLAQVLNETLRPGNERALHDAREVAKHLLNRTFETQYTDMAIDDNGFRAKQMEILYHDRESVRKIPGHSNSLSVLTLWAPVELPVAHSPLKPFLIESRKNYATLERMSDISAFWPGGVWPPKNEPLCGYKGEKRNCDKSGHNAAIITPVAVGLLCLFPLLCRFRRYLLRVHEIDEWWRLPYTGHGLRIPFEDSVVISLFNSDAIYTAQYTEFN